MGVKVFFTGNPLASDDGIGPYLYHQLSGDKRLEGINLEEIGVIGFDMISYIDKNDRIIIVDAMRDTKQLKKGKPADFPIGKVIILDEKDLTPDLSLVSQHDFGIEETARVIRMYLPDLLPIHIIGIIVKDTQPFSDQLSAEIMSRINDIKEEVISAIMEIRGV